MKQIRHIISLLSVLSGIVLYLAGPIMLTKTQSMTAALTLVAVVFWITGSIPQHVTALLVFLVTMLFSIVPADIIFSGFFSTAFWLVFAGLVIGIGINGTGLGTRIAGKISTYLCNSYSRLIFGLVLIGILFSFLMPSAMGRVVLLVPIAEAIARYFGFEKDTNGYTGVILACILGSYIPAFSILPSNIPNMVLAGMSESLYQYSPLYGEYLLLHFPVLGLLKAAIVAGLILFFYPDVPHMDNQSILETKSMSKKEIILSLVLLLLIALWVTDGYHHISPAWIALAGAVFLMLPLVGIIDPGQFNEKINYSSLFFVAAILGLGRLINYSGLGEVLASSAISSLPLNPQTPFINYALLTLTAAITGIVTTLPGIPVVLTPLAGGLAHATGFTLQSVLMTQVIGFSIIIFPYQAPPLIVGMQMAQVKHKEAFKVCISLALVTFLLLLIINYFWWRLLGWL
ncbi:SLC13 family permease [Desulfobacter vibrioformis]|uniref:SLC13 family permease n=1 Tax=Desulfobacter vibrioformis TaxID=34031 RepID=UPI0005558E27|nr:SLC13 family permease [Desulfobacter vibrioformis]